MDPDAFEVRPAQEEVARYSDAILHGYRMMDRLMGDFLELERQGVTLAFATALSQQPFLKWEHIGGQKFYRPIDVERMLNDFGIRFTSVEPVMTHQFMVRFANPEAADLGQKILSGMRLNGVDVFGIHRRHADGILFGSAIRSVVDESAFVKVEGSNGSWRFLDKFYLLDATKSGSHHPDGVFWIRSDAPAHHSGKVSILNVFPTILDLMGIPCPESYSGPGRTLLSKSRTAPVPNIQSAA